MGLTAVTVSGGLLTARLFLWPQTPTVSGADAVIVLAGGTGDRLSKAWQMMQAGVAPVLVLDGRPDLPSIGALCESHQPFEIVCLRPDPDSTRTEAQEAGRLAAARGWRTVVVVTTRSHVTRAAMMFRRCTTATVEMVGTNARYPLRVKVEAIAHEWAGMAHALTFARQC